MQTVTHNNTQLQHRIITPCRVTPAYDINFSPEQVIYVRAEALWDTGATESVISIQLAQYLKLTPIRKQIMNTANGVAMVNMYEVNIELDNGMQFNDLLVNAAQLPNVHVLIGMDVIAQGDLAITNGNRHTTFSFQIPATRNIEFDKEQTNSQDTDDQYDLYVRRKIAQMDYNNGLKTAREKGVKEGAKNTAIQKDIEWILALHNMGLPFENIAQAAKKTVDDVINIVKEYKKKGKLVAV
jgi:predicted aspartyl protease